jgi:hypothetical protein
VRKPSGRSRSPARGSVHSATWCSGSTTRELAVHAAATRTSYRQAASRSANALYMAGGASTGRRFGNRLRQAEKMIQ